METYIFPTIGDRPVAEIEAREILHLLTPIWFARAETARRARLAFEWKVLTPTRSRETRLARWSEIDDRTRLWRIPAQRMKARRAHTIPLSKRCLEILRHARAMYPSSDLIFPGTKLGSALSDMTFTKVLRDIGYAQEATPHGMRSAFKVWCAEVAKVRDEVSEAALAHAIPQKVRAAYLRTDFLEERKALMNAWAKYCAKAVPVTQKRSPSDVAA